MKKLIVVLLALLFCTVAPAEGNGMKYDFSVFTNVTLKGIDTSTLNEDELSALYQAARYCQAMTEADIDTMREIVSEEMKFVHMSGMTQTCEEYFADVADGSLSQRVEMGFWENLDDGRVVMRIATSWATSREDVDRLIACL